MTIPYNSKEFGLSKKLEEGFTDKYFISENILNQLDKGDINLNKAINLSEIQNEENRISKQNQEKFKDSFDTPIKTELEKNIRIEGKYIFKPSKEISNNKDDDNLYLTSKEIYKLASVIKSTVSSIIPPFDQLNKYFEEIIKILKIHNLPIF